METPIAAGLSGLAELVGRKWFAAMGLIGILMFVTGLMFDFGKDPTLFPLIGLIFMGWGFGQAECRTFRERHGPGFKITGPAWVWSVSGVLLFATSIGAMIATAARLIWTF